MELIKLEEGEKKIMKRDIFILLKKGMNECLLEAQVSKRIVGSNDECFLSRGNDHS